MRSRQCLPALPCALYRLWMLVREAILCTPRAHCCWLFLLLILPCALGDLSGQSLVTRCARRVLRDVIPEELFARFNSVSTGGFVVRDCIDVPQRHRIGITLVGHKAILGHTSLYFILKCPSCESKLAKKVLAISGNSESPTARSLRLVYRKMIRSRPRVRFRHVGTADRCNKAAAPSII